MPGSCDPHLSGIAPDRFDPAAYLAQHDQRLLLDPEGRRTLTRLDPLLFALTYLRHHLKSPETGDRLSFSRFHLDFFDSAKQWARRDLGPAEIRDCWIAPRGSGKSTLAFLCLPLWALAHGHRRYVVAMADSGPQAQQHLASLKLELDNNPLLRRDYPGLCAPAKRAGGTNVSDSQAFYVAANGAAFTAKGIDSSTLGAKVGSTRPDLLLFDDIEPDESNYSEYQKGKRLATVVNAVFAMNPNAVVAMVGTVTMAGSIIHDIARQVTDTAEDAPKWPRVESIRPRYYPALYVDDDGAERSLWPERWPLDYLLSVKGTTSFELNMQNNPRGRNGDYWTPDDFWHETLGDAATRWILQIDPAVTTKGTSDWTGLAVVGYAPPVGEQRGMCEVAVAKGVKLAGDKLRAEVLRILAQHPRIKYVRVEVNQGGELWQTVLRDLPVKLLVHTSNASKEVRFAEALDYYQRRRVVHTVPLTAAEEQMCGFPKMAHDDIADAVCGGILYFLGRREKATARSRSYV